MSGHFGQLPLYSTTYFLAVAQGRGALWVKWCRFSHVSVEGRRINLNFFFFSCCQKTTRIYELGSEIIFGLDEEKNSFCVVFKCVLTCDYFRIHQSTFFLMPWGGLFGVNVVLNIRS